MTASCTRSGLLVGTVFLVDALAESRARKEILSAVSQSPGVVLSGQVVPILPPFLPRLERLHIEWLIRAHQKGRSTSTPRIQCCLTNASNPSLRPLVK
jgi:hypothetical protein